VRAVRDRRALPEVRSAENVLALQDEIERLESMLADRASSTTTRSTATTPGSPGPGVLLAGSFGWRPRPFFDAEPGAARRRRPRRRHRAAARRDAAVTDRAGADRSPTRLVLVRHGETAWSKAGRHTGRTDVPLTDAGREQARRSGRPGRADVQPRRGRARCRARSETARLAGFGDRIELDDDLREWTTASTRADAARHRRATCRAGPSGASPIVGGETLAELGDAADRVIAALLPAGGDVLVFSHGHFLRVLAARWIESRRSPRAGSSCGPRRSPSSAGSRSDG
jgi:probable phosphoglycerate mutase